MKIHPAICFLAALAQVALAGGLKTGVTDGGAKKLPLWMHAVDGEALTVRAAPGEARSGAGELQIVHLGIRVIGTTDKTRIVSGKVSSDSRRVYIFAGASDPLVGATILPVAMPLRDGSFSFELPASGSGRASGPGGVVGTGSPQYLYFGVHGRPLVRVMLPPFGGSPPEEAGDPAGRVGNACRTREDDHP